MFLKSNDVMLLSLSLIDAIIALASSLRSVLTWRNNVKACRCSSSSSVGYTMKWIYEKEFLDFRKWQIHLNSKVVNHLQLLSDLNNSQSETLPYLSGVASHMPFAWESWYLAHMSAFPTLLIHINYTILSPTANIEDIRCVYYILTAKAYKLIPIFINQLLWAINLVCSERCVVL